MRRRRAAERDGLRGNPRPGARVVGFVKRNFYIRTGRGSGAIWHVMQAESAAEIRARYPFVTVSEARPGWWNFRHPLPALDIDAQNRVLGRIAHAQRSTINPERQMQLALCLGSLVFLVGYALI